MKATVADVLDAMPLDQRQVLEWKYFDRCSVSEIAQRLGRTEKSVEAILYRARITFREQYKIAVE
jgi:RNA polymerase sigma-70 factor (ECF subfamily)